jgi:hypothetical protein
MLNTPAAPTRTRRHSCWSGPRLLVWRPHSAVQTSKYSFPGYKSHPGLRFDLLRIYGSAVHADGGAGNVLGHRNQLAVRSGLRIAQRSYRQIVHALRCDVVADLAGSRVLRLDRRIRRDSARGVGDSPGDRAAVALPQKYRTKREKTDSGYKYARESISNRKLHPLETRGMSGHYAQGPIRGQAEEYGVKSYAETESRWQRPKSIR